MIDLAESSIAERRLLQPKTLRSILWKCSSRLAGAVCVVQLMTPLSIAEETVPITRDMTASLVRLAPRILISAPAPSFYEVVNEQTDEVQNERAGKHIVIADTLASLVIHEQPPQLQEFESLPAPSANNTVEVEVETPNLVEPVPLTEMTLPEPSADVSDGRSPEFFDSPDIGSGLLESDVLDLDDAAPKPEPSPSEYQRVIARLDIRPRKIGPSSQEFVPDADLPSDTSGLTPQPQVPSLVQLHQADLTMRDIWAGASFCHQPLYFEDQRLERCGVIDGPLHLFPSLHSGVHFAIKAGLLPIAAAVNPPCSSVRSGCSPTSLTRLFK